MRSVPSRTPRSHAFVPALALLSLFAIAGCENKHIGRPCELTVTADAGSGGGAVATINDQALECPSRICLQPGGEKTTDTGPYCTAECSENSDCEDGEGGPLGDPNNHQCETGFVCAVATTAGDFCCRKMCICRDFVDVPVGGFQTPEVCKSGQSTCVNVN